ncbi:MAG: GNAT family N-acetyltransferase [Cellvibrionaceae bacterium]
MDTSTATHKFLNSIHQVDADAWDNHNSQAYPFLKHGFLAALEDSQSVCANSGWQPCHIVIEEKGELLAALPLYLKGHSYGEYVFDWSWADAYARNGLQYYPKLLTAIPFTPCQGPRLLGHQRFWPIMVCAIQQFAQERGISGWHCLFTESEDQTALAAQSSLCKRQDTQFHWLNQHFANKCEKYRDFDDFTGTFRSPKRKALKKERRQVAEQGLTVRWFKGSDITEALWDAFYDFYRATYAKRSGHGGYLQRDFFSKLVPALGDQVLLNLAFLDGGVNSEPVAGALYFQDQDTLYGRYWGCSEAFQHLHFECCYYQGIEYAIQQGLACFNAGAQGEHKLARGFTPVITQSFHWLADDRFHQAIEDFVEREQTLTNQYQKQCRDALPFKREATPSVPSITAADLAEKSTTSLSS